MVARTSVITSKHQQGLVLLVLVIIIVLAFTSYLFSDLSITQIRMSQAKSTLTTLKKAKQAVINYAATSIERSASGDYGLLPCPETFLNGNYGNMAGGCGGQNMNVVEWLPWRSLDLSTLKDESGTCLFYAVSGTYKLGSSQADMINEDSIGMFQVVDSAGNILKGLNLEDQIVAFVIAPGAPLPGQTRNPLFVTSNCGDDYGNQSAYLEGDGFTDNSAVSVVEDSIDQFIHATEASATESSAYNDKFLAITRDEVWNAIVERSDFKQKMENLTQALAMCLTEYANMPDNNSRRLPWPVQTNLGVITNYRDNNNYVDDAGASGGYSGRYPFKVADSNNSINAVSMTQDILFEINNICKELDLGGGLKVDLKTTTSEYRKLWNNWKDHFFYVLSKEYEPDSTGAKTCDGAGVCISVNVNEYAGAVIFSGSRLDGITRNDRSDVSDYLEDGKGAEFVSEAGNKTGDRTYLYTDPQTDTVNDVMYCIEDKVNLGEDLTVIECL